MSVECSISIKEEEEEANTGIHDGFYGAEFKSLFIAREHDDTGIAVLIMEQHLCSPSSIEE